MSQEMEAWESEGGTVLAPPFPHPVQMKGTANQVEWAQRIRCRVSAEFDRVAASFRSVAEKQYDGNRADTEAIIGILEEKRSEVMSREEAGYFIHDWQEINDQVRQMIAHDSRYQEIKARPKLHQKKAIEWSPSASALP